MMGGAVLLVLQEAGEGGASSLWDIGATPFADLLLVNTIVMIGSFYETKYLKLDDRCQSKPRPRTLPSFSNETDAGFSCM